MNAILIGRFNNLRTDQCMNTLFIMPLKIEGKHAMEMCWPGIIH